MSNAIIMDVSEILNSFDISEMKNLIYSQIPLEKDADTFLDISTNYFKPIYGEYRNALENSPEEFHQEITERFYELCNVYIARICEKFDLTINNDWLNENARRIPIITMTLYSYFILDFASNMQEAILKYILKNKSQLCEIFSDMKGKKDSSSMINKKLIQDEEVALITSCIFDVIKYILDTLEEEDYLELTDENEIGKAIHELMNEMIISGNFMQVIKEIYDENIPLRSNIGFELVCKLKEQFTMKEEE